jgi:glyoxylase-like metal-dependent hydrolase (beta-lactamase superfamily II)
MGYAANAADAVCPGRRFCDLSEDFTAGRAVGLAPGVRRVLARNPGPLTGPGTNTWMVGDAEVAVIDPGPADPAHVEAIVAASGGRIRWILVTHTHRDHSPASALLRERTGAPVVGRRAPDDGRQDRRFQPDIEPGEGEGIELAGRTLRCIPTPGHASNHVCWLLPDAGILFSGDHILGAVTPVILPPDGDMDEYLQSLARLRALPLSRIAPGHGPVLDDPPGVIDGLVAHRLRREAKVSAALEPAPLTLDGLLPRVYADVDLSLHDLARHTLLAHLIRLERRGIARRSGDGWSRA